MAYLLRYQNLEISSSQNKLDTTGLHVVATLPRRHLLEAGHVLSTRNLSAACIILGALLFLYLVVNKYRTILASHDQPTNNSDTARDRVQPESQPTIFSPIIRRADDLLFLCNDEVSPSLQVIGRGGCGEVYKAELATGGRTIPVAIKKIVQPVMIDARNLTTKESKIFSHRMRQIRSEVLTVGHMRHPNLLRLLAHVPVRSSCHYLLYDFMKNGSLHDILKSKARSRSLRWPGRHKIAHGVAAGLEYLHMVHQPKIIHRDLKPANILLDDHMNPCISDFGLAKVVTCASDISINTKHVAGTMGFIAPEYYRKMTFTEKIDVYSFGVILAVLVTGKFPTDKFFQETEEISMVGWVRRVVASDNPTEAIDSSLLGDGFKREMMLVLKIACFCTYDDPKERPNSRDVLRMLSQIKHGEEQQGCSSYAIPDKHGEDIV